MNLRNLKILQKGKSKFWNGKMFAQIISMQKKMAMLASLAALQTLNGKKMKPSKIEKIAAIIFASLLASLLAYSFFKLFIV